MALNGHWPCVSFSLLQAWQSAWGLVPLQKWQNSHWEANKKEVRRKKNSLLSFPLLFSSAVLSSHPVKQLLVQCTADSCLPPGEVSNVSAPASDWKGFKPNLFTIISTEALVCVLSDQCLILYHCPGFHSLYPTCGPVQGWSLVIYMQQFHDNCCDELLVFMLL